LLYLLCKLAIEKSKNFIIKKNNQMKKIYLIAIIVFTLIFSSKAQSDCDNSCTYGPLITDIYEICHYLYSGPNPSGTLVVEEGMSVFVMTNYRIMNCNGVQSIQIDGTCLFDLRAHWQQLYLIPI
jgi:hypothetical protein